MAWRRGAAAWPWARVALLLLAAAAAAGPSRGAQATGVLRVTVSLVNDAGQPTPVRRHALLVSDDPPSRAPWRIVTRADGSGKVTLPPGNYTVESEEPVILRGRAYEWRQTLEVSAGADVSLALTADNADTSAATAPADDAASSRSPDPFDLLVRWQDSVVAIWTPLAHGAGVVASADGLVATTARLVASDTPVVVQVSRTLNVQARVLLADPVRDVAVLWVAPAALGPRPAAPLACDAESRPALAAGQRLSTIGVPVRRQPTTTSGRVSRTSPTSVEATFEDAPDSAGGPVFGDDGALVGLATLGKDAGPDGEPVAGVVRAGEVCVVLAEARARMTGTPPPADARPVEPDIVIAESDLRAAAERRAGSLTPPKISSDTFDIEFITPATAFAGMERAMDFGQWNAYVADHPGVLLVRVAPRQVESLWLKVARGAAMTQGIALPPITHHEPGFASMRVRCGSADATPIHPLIVERRVSERTSVREGLYAFTADALGPQCGVVTFDIASERAPARFETARADGALLARLQEDLAPYRVSAR